MTGYRVLFVDDEPYVLSGLRRVMRNAPAWEVSFAGSGQEALELLATQPVDVVISDMRMPGMDGAELLAHVRSLYPSTGRMILSGQADREAIIKAVGPTQQFLVKPCDADTLIEVVTRLLAVRSLVTDERLRRILGDVEVLPKPPAVHAQMMEVSSRPDAVLADVVAVIESDIALCAEVLKLVNSAFFGLSRHIDSVERAASLLGLNTIHALAVSGKVFGPGTGTPRNLDLVAIRNRGLTAAAYARAIARTEGWTAEATSQAFLAALFRDLGLLVLVANRPDGYDRVLAVPASDWEARRQAELDNFGCSVSEASAYLLGMWGFSEPVVDAMAGQPTRANDPATTRVAEVVHFAHHRAVLGVFPAPGAPACLDDVRYAMWNDACNALDAASAPSKP